MSLSFAQCGYNSIVDLLGNAKCRKRPLYGNAQCFDPSSDGAWRLHDASYRFVH